MLNKHAQLFIAGLFFINTGHLTATEPSFIEQVLSVKKAALEANKQLIAACNNLATIYANECLERVKDAWTEIKAKDKNKELALNKAGQANQLAYNAMRFAKMIFFLETSFFISTKIHPRTQTDTEILATEADKQANEVYKFAESMQG